MREYWERLTHGPAFIVLGTLCFSVQDIIMKTLGIRGYSLLELTFFRCLSAIATVIVISLFVRQKVAFVPRDAGMLLLRSLIQFVSYVCYFLGIASLPYGNAIALSVTSPIWLVISGVVLFKESLSALKVVCVLAGFSGALLIAVPSSGLIQWGALFSLVSAFTYSFQQLLSRKLGARNGAAVIVLAMYFTMLSVSSFSGIFYHDGFDTNGLPGLDFISRPWRRLSNQDLILISICGVVHSMGSLCMVRGYVAGPTSVVAPFEYVALFWAASWGLILWGEVPTLQAMAGIVIIGIMGIVLARGAGNPRLLRLRGGAEQQPTGRTHI